MSDLIDRQKAIDAVNELTRWYYETYHETRPTAIAVIDKLINLPSAEPEIIRCKDCRHWMDIDDGRQRHKMCADLLGDWFCADAEPKEGEEDDEW